MNNKLKTRKIFAWLLFPLTMWYAVAVAMRNFFFNIGILKERTHKVTTIAVGNLCTGGAGKTPFVDYLLKMLNADYRTASLSRGYGRHTKGFLEAGDSATASEIGDEPMLLHRRNPDVRVAVCEDRNTGIERLLSEAEPPQIVVLDDAYQHRYVKPTVNILLTEYGNPFFNDQVLPFGNLREPRRNYRRASVIVVTKSPKSLNPLDRRMFVKQLKPLPHQQVFFTAIEYHDLIPMDGGMPPKRLADLKQVLFVSGIANPQPAIDRISTTATVNSLAFADHHNFSKADFEQIAYNFQQMSGDEKIIVTTEKDAVRIAGTPGFEVIAQLPVYYLPIEIRFLGDDEKKFSDCLLNTVKENVFFHRRNG